MQIYISHHGNDKWSGTFPEADEQGNDGPVQSLEKAQTLAREATARNESVEVVLRGGTYRRTTPLEFSSQDGGTQEAPVVWRNYAGEAPVLSGGQPITDWKRADRLNDIPDQIPEEALQNLYVAELPARPGTANEAWKFYALFDTQGALPRAAHTDVKPDPDREADSSSLPFVPGTLTAPPNLDMVEIRLAARSNFVWHILPVAEIDVDGGWIKTASPAGYPLKPTGKPLGDSDTRFIHLENVPAGLTSPGTWWLDTATNRLYLWPRDSKAPEDIEAPVLRELIALDGDFDNGDVVQNLYFQGITFKRGDRWVMHKDRVSLQHDWEWQDSPNALVRLRGTEEIAVSSCRFHESGGTALRLDLHAQRNRIESNSIHDMGGTGICLAGFGPGDRDENRQNVLKHNHVYRVGQSFRASSGIFVSQSSDNQIQDNFLHTLPYAAIVVSGPRTHLFDNDDSRPGTYEGAQTIDQEELGEVPLRFEHHMGFIHSRYNVVEHNEICHVMQKLGDGNAIYLSGTGNGNVVRRNYVHDLHGNGLQSAIRTDGWQWFTRLYENIVWRVNAGALTVKQINDFDNNFLVDCRRFGCILARRSPGGEAWGCTVRRNIMYQTQAEIDQQNNNPGYYPFYEECGEKSDGIHGKLAHLVIEDNLLYCEEDQSVAEETLRQIRKDLGKEQRGMAADPGFVDVTNGDFRLRKDSPAFRLGIRPIEDWGVRDKSKLPHT